MKIMKDEFITPMHLLMASAFGLAMAALALFKGFKAFGFFLLFISVWFGAMALRDINQDKMSKKV